MSEVTKSGSSEAPMGEMVGIDDEPVAMVTQVIRGPDIPKFLKAQQPMPYHDGKTPNVLKVAGAALRAAMDPDRREAERLKREDPTYRPVMALSRKQAERLGLCSSDRVSHLDRLLEGAPTAEAHELALESGKGLSLPMLADPGEGHDHVPGLSKKRLELVAGDTKPVQLSANIAADPGLERLNFDKDVAAAVETGSPAPKPASEETE